MTTEPTILHAPDDWGEDRCPLIDGWYYQIDEDYSIPFATEAEALASLVKLGYRITNTEDEKTTIEEA